jgi:hypothetical protein
MLSFLWTENNKEIKSDSESESDSDSDTETIINTKLTNDKLTNSKILETTVPTVPTVPTVSSLKFNKNNKTNTDIFTTKTLGRIVSKTTTNKYCMRSIKVKDLIVNIEKSIITIPEFQRDIDMLKVNNMIKSFEDNNNIYNYITNPLQIAYLIHSDCTNLMLIDGQHRYNMYKELYNQNRIQNHELLINYTACENIDEVVNLYLTLNKDNPKIIKLNRVFNDTTNILMEQRYRVIKNYLSIYYKQYFKKNSTILYDVEEFVCKLIEINYLENFDTNDDAITYILNLNDYYLDYYNEYIQKYNDKTFKNKGLKKEEFDILSKKIDKPLFFTFKNNNFIMALACSDDDINDFKFQHYFQTLNKNSKKTIAVKK